MFTILRKIVTVLALFTIVFVSAQQQTHKRYNVDDESIPMVYETDISMKIVDEIFWNSLSVGKKYSLEIDYIEVYHMRNNSDIHCVIVFRKIPAKNFMYNKDGKFIRKLED